MSLARYLSKITQLLNSSGQVLTGGIADSAVTIGKVDTSVSQLFGMRNRIINGDMRIDQRNAGASVTQNTTGIYTLDRWSAYGVVTSKFTVQQNAGSVTPPVGFTKYLGCTSTSAYSLTSTDIYIVQQNIEGYNIADLGWGTANAKTVTLSFWAYSSLTGTFGGSLTGGNTRNYPFSYSIPVANTWTRISITIAGDTSGTWGSTNGNGILVNWSLGTGTNYSNTAGAWTASASYSATGATSVVGTSGATFYITGVQLEKGSVATPFENRQYGQELALCQRYYSRLTYDGTGGEVTYGIGIQQGTTYAYIYVPYLVTMRSEPTAAISNLQVSNFRSFSTDCTLTSIQAGYSSCSLIVGFAASGAPDLPIFMQNKNNLAGFLSFSAEL